MNIQNKAVLLQLIEITFGISEGDDDEYLNFVTQSTLSSDEENEEKIAKRNISILISLFRFSCKTF